MKGLHGLEGKIVINAVVCGVDEATRSYVGPTFSNCLHTSAEIHIAGVSVFLVILSDCLERCVIVPFGFHVIVQHTHGLGSAPFIASAMRSFETRTQDLGKHLLHAD